MLEYKCQRVYRDARIMSIYEGTTQLQTVAAIRYITSGFYEGIINEYAQEPVAAEYAPVAQRIAAMYDSLKACTAKAKEAANNRASESRVKRSLGYAERSRLKAKPTRSTSTSARATSTR